MQVFQVAGQKNRIGICWLLCSIALVSCKPNSVEVQSSPANPIPTSSAQSPASSLPSIKQATPEVSSSEEVQAPRPHPAFRSIFPALQYQTEMPIILPGHIPGRDSASPLYAILESATASSYQILLAFTENCNGGNACRLGSVSGQSVLSESVPLEGQPVDLRDEITGYFVEATCGANCSDATLTWEQDGYRYTVGIKAGNEADLVEMANSAIANGIL